MTLLVEEKEPVGALAQVGVRRPGAGGVRA
jgi:hypothetical protein